MIGTFFINSFIVTAVVLVHYETLYRLSRLVPKLPILHRLRVLFALFGSLIAHIVEIWIFGFGYYFMLKLGDYGALSGNFDNSLIDCVYFSFTTYTSLGFGDIAPLGHVRFLAGLEALTGLVLITWSASFMFIEMQKFWNGR